MFKYSNILLITSAIIWSWDRNEKDKPVLIRDHFHYTISKVEKLDVQFDYKMGELIIGPNEKTTFDGFSEYASPFFSSPGVTYVVSGKTGVLKFKTISSHEHDDFDWDFDEFHHSSEFLLPVAIPIDFELDFGMGEAELNFNNLHLNTLNVECGMGELSLKVEKPNPIQCSEITIETGMGEFEGSGLGFLRPKIIRVEVGLGSATIDLSDTVMNNIDINVEVGLGEIELLLPKNVNVSAAVNDHFLSSVELEDMVKKGHKYYSTTRNDKFPVITLDISVGLGSVKVKMED